MPKNFSELKSVKFGIRSKVFLGSAIIMAMLLLSVLISFLEFGRMNRYLSNLISRNILSVDLSRNLLNQYEKFNSDFFQIWSSDNMEESPLSLLSDNFDDEFARLQKTLETEKEKTMADSVRYAYSAYKQVVIESETLWMASKEVRTEWYFSKIQVVFEKFRAYLQRLSDSSQLALTDNYDNLQDSYYRSTMPGIVSMGACVLLVILFCYFLNIYIIVPVLKISKGVRTYRNTNKTYDVDFDNGGDQIHELNDNVKELLAEHKSFVKNKYR